MGIDRGRSTGAKSLGLRAIRILAKAYISAIIYVGVGLMALKMDSKGMELMATCKYPPNDGFKC